MSVVSPRAVFVGRDQEIAALAEHLVVGRPAATVLIVAGPAGVGKTTLVDEALRRGDGVDAVRGYCPAEPAPPLWPWRSALRRAGIDLAPSLDLARGPEVEPAAAPSARLAALSAMCEALLAAGPFVVVLEDLHWADAASLDLLAQVAMAGAEGVRIVGTLRSPAPEEVAVRLAELARYGTATLTLAPFTVAEVAGLVGPDAAAEVERRTGGLPLLVAAVRDGRSSSDVAMVVRALLAALSPAQRVVIEAAAVLGENVDEALLAAVVSGPDRPLSDVDIDGALVAAWRGGILTTDAGRYRFAHALVRDGIVDLLDPAAARALHRGAAKALESSADRDRAARIAAHWRRVGTDPQARRAAAFWARAAAAAARSAQAYTDAVRLLRAALADLPDADGVVRTEVLLELAHAEFLAGRYDECLARCTDAAETAAGAGRGDLVARAALVLQGVTYPRAGHIVSRLCERALGYPDLAIGLRARLLAQHAVMMADAGRLPAAVMLARESLDLAAASGDPQAEIEAARAREVTLTQPDDADERLRLGALVADRAEALGQPLAALIGHQWRIQAAYLYGRLDVVEEATTAVGQLAARSGLALARWHHARLLAARTALVGRFAESSAHSAEATAFIAGSADQTAVSMHFAHAFQLSTVRGTTDDLPAGYPEALARAPSMPLLEVERSIALVVTGRLDEARAIYDGVARRLPLPPDHQTWAAVLLKLCWLIVAFDDAEAARITYRQLLPFRPYPGALGTCTAYFGGTVSRPLAELATVFGDDAGAEELFREALVRNQVLGAAPDVALTRLGLARLLYRGGGRAALDEAAGHAGAALRIATELDMPSTVAAARALATQIAAGRREADPLTAREREVAVLLAGALSNRQIADRLVLSERTVESHVRNILAKTGCANRTEFVARGATPQ